MIPKIMVKEILLMRNVIIQRSIFRNMCQNYEWYEPAQYGKVQSLRFLHHMKTVALFMSALEYPMART